MQQNWTKQKEKKAPKIDTIYSYTWESHKNTKLEAVMYMWL